jgi:hypothetical protein
VVVTRATAEALDDLLARLDRAGFGAHTRHVRLAVRAHGECTLEIAGGTIAVRRRTSDGALAAEVVVGGKVTHVRPAKEEAAEPMPRRSFRLDDERWRELAKYGPPGTVVQDAVDLYLREKRGR